VGLAIVEEGNADELDIVNAANGADLSVRMRVACLAASIACSKSAFALREPVRVTVRLENVGADNVTVVPPVITPNIVFFRVIDPHGRELLYLGPWAKLAAFSPDMFSELPAGGSTEHSFDLAEFYSFDRGDSYAVRATYRNFDDGSRFGISAITTDGLESNTVIINTD
jgi:hypothetical protein